MARDFLSDRKVALENAFFAERDAMLRRQFGEEEQVKLRRDTLSAASGIKDAVVLDKVLAQNVTRETLAALFLVPLVVVAWADGTLDARERSAVLAAAEQAGLDKQHAGYRLLECWLTRKPPPELLARWKAYVSALSMTLTEEARDAIQSEVIGRATTIAKAAGGFIGIGRKVSSDEAAVLTELEQAFFA